MCKTVCAVLRLFQEVLDFFNVDVFVPDANPAVFGHKTIMFHCCKESFRRDVWGRSSVRSEAPDASNSGTKRYLYHQYYDAKWEVLSWVMRVYILVYYCKCDCECDSFLLVTDVFIVIMVLFFLPPLTFLLTQHEWEELNTWTALHFSCTGAALHTFSSSAHFLFTHNAVAGWIFFVSMAN